MLEDSAVLKLRSSCSKMLLGTLIIYFSMLNLDNLVDMSTRSTKESHDCSSQTSAVELEKGKWESHADSSPKFEGVD